MSMTFFEGMSPSRVKRALNVLLEAPFFYPSDDPELFAWVRRHRVELARFFAEVFEWHLAVERDVARVHKARWHNAAITPKQRSSFEPTRGAECIALLLLLEMEGPRFTMGELLAHGMRRLGELGLAKRFDETRLRDAYRDLVPALLRHRLVREAEAGEVATYEALPGLRVYDRAALDEAALKAAFGAEEPS